MSIYNPPYTEDQLVHLTPTAADAFGRLRVSPPETIFDSKQIFDNQPLFWDDQETSGSGTTSVHSVAEARTRMGVANTTAGTRVRQTFMRFNYQPGKSQLVLCTAVMSGTPTGITGRVGMFDENNGVFYSIVDGVLNANIRSSTSGSPVDETIPQSAWNGDKLDGTGPSGQTLDPTATQIIWYDMEWLGVGTIRSGFVIDGQFILCHSFHHSNNGLATVYMSTPNLPLRFELSNDGTGPATTMDHICSTVISERGSQELGYTHYVSTAGTHVNCNTENVIYAILGVRLKSTRFGATVRFLEAALSEHTGNKEFEWTLRLNPSVAGTFTYADVDSDVSLQYATGATANVVTGGHILAGGLAASNTKGGAGSSKIDSALRLGSTIAGVPDEMVLCVMPIGGSSNLDIEGGINFQEAS